MVPQKNDKRWSSCRCSLVATVQLIKVHMWSFYVLPTKDVIHGIQQWGCVCGQYVVLWTSTLLVCHSFPKYHFLLIDNAELWCCYGTQTFVVSLLIVLVRTWTASVQLLWIIENTNCQCSGHIEHRSTLLVAVVLCWCGRCADVVDSNLLVIYLFKVGMEHIIFLVFRISILDHYLLLEIWSCLNKNSFICDLCVCDHLFDLVYLMSTDLFWSRNCWCNLRYIGFVSGNMYSNWYVISFHCWLFHRQEIAKDVYYMMRILA